MKIQTLTALTGLALLSGSANATTVLFDLTNGSGALPGAVDLPGNNTSFLTDGAAGQVLTDNTGGSGLTVTVSPVVVTLPGPTNVIDVNGGLGIGAPEGGGNWGNPADAIDFVFNQDVKLDAFYFSHGPSNATRSFGGTPVLDFGGADTTLSSLDVSITNTSDKFLNSISWTNDANNVTLLAGQVLRLNYFDGTNPFNEAGFVGAIEVTIIPEPSSLALLGLGGLMIARRRRA